MQPETPPVKEKPFMDLFGDITAEDVTQLVRAGADVNLLYRYVFNLQMQTDGTTPLHHAKSASVAEALIAHGANVNAEDHKGLTPIYHMRSVAIAEVLVAHGADVNGTHPKGVTPLHHHIENPSFAQALITLGADANAWDCNGVTPLHLCKNASLAETLIAHGADVNAADRDGFTPLHRASRMGNLSVIQALIEAGADINARSYFAGETPLDGASEFEPDIQEAMVFAGAENSSHNASLFLSPECVEARDRGQARRQAALRTQRAGTLESLYAALDAPAEPVAPRSPRVRQRC